ncbi:cytochrome c biogenesis protein ResB [Microlunatus panaciterrae]|uniref:Cytochrome c biogenesis protein n=1 Tax=Microlunatus panaciterrae TaxID=400768 RepID=A0ABS2RJK2_9ACTN|nr:cytochrome c biogenesis protein ResB [Microlunatus panaciterrae]MBM7798376.1 cytochrome c biogenesis protein [Microlunatus panaciterrae]
MASTPTESPPKQHRPRPGAAGPLGLVGSLRFVWTQLTSMRTALVLLFSLALAAIPGSLIPQRKVSPIRVDDFITQHPTLGPLYDKVGLFNVFTSPWFSAIYLLLFVSLVGCIIPRVRVYARALRAAPPPTPRNLSRLPVFTSREIEAGRQDDLLDRAADRLQRQRYRVRRQPDSISAERGYLREAGNLVFHISLLFLLLGVAIGGLTGFRGTSVVVVGQGFANSLTQYDDFSAGSAFSASDLDPFSLVVNQFDVKFETGPVQTGAARLFKARVTVTDEPGATPHDEVLEVNKPLKVGGSTVHLIGHGYAPVVTIKDADGNVAYSGPVVFLPQDGNFTSAGVIKAPDARPERLAFEGFFLPTAVVNSQGPHSVFPDAVDPALFLNAWYGPPKKETGQPENVYSLDKTGMTQLKNPAGTDVLRFVLRPGEYKELPGGKGTISFDGYQRWVKLQVGDTPGIQVSLTAIGLAVLGLCLSLFIRPRRVWVRLLTTESSRGTVVEVAGLDRADARAGLSEDVEQLAAELTGSPADASGVDDAGADDSDANGESGR